MPQLVERLAEVHVRQAWAAVVGGDVARRARPGRLAEGCLTVVVDNSPWLHELTLREQEILGMIQRRWPAVKSLRLSVGPLPSAADEVAANVAPRRAHLSDRDRREIEEATAGIADAALATAVRRVLARARGVSGAIEAAP
jgi:hypothetical protein